MKARDAKHTRLCVRFGVYVRVVQKTTVTKSRYQSPQLLGRTCLQQWKTRIRRLDALHRLGISQLQTSMESSGHSQPSLTEVYQPMFPFIFHSCSIHVPFMFQSCSITISYHLCLCSIAISYYFITTPLYHHDILVIPPFLLGNYPCLLLKSPAAKNIPVFSEVSEDVPNMFLESVRFHP